MKNINILLVSFLLFSGFIFAQNPDPNFRILIHSTSNNFEDSNFGIAGWAIVPNVAKAPSNWVGIAGIKYSKQNFWIELMGGAAINGSNIDELVDVRVSATHLKPITLWSNIQWIEGKALYVYFQCDHWIENIFALGLETENLVFRNGEKDMFSYGPHIIIPINKMTLVGVYQFHGGVDQFWVRVVLDL